MRTSKRTACSSGRGSLCGSGGSASEQAALQLATAPQAFDARSSFVNLTVVGPVKNQAECGICVAFAVLAAAQTAAAVALKLDFGGSSLSEQDFFFCRPGERNVIRDCGAGWSLKEGMFAFTAVQFIGKLPVTEACLPFTPTINAGGAATCRRTCTTTLQQLLQGDFKARPLGNIWDMQRHIRQHGSIVCRMQLFSDIRPFFVDSPLGVYKGPGPNATQEEAHAVQVVGYDNNRQAWLIKNSWGPGFADKGFGWVSFDAPSMCDPQDAYGFVFEPYLAPTAALSKLTPAPGRKGCFTYKAVAGDYPDKLSLQFGVPVQQLLLDNLETIKDPSTVPASATVLLCGVSSATATGALALPGNASAAGARTKALVTNSSSASSSSDSVEEVRVLMAIKRVLDPGGSALQDWQLDSPSPCSWTGIICDKASGRVTEIFNWDNVYKTSRFQLSGQLPSGALLARLPALVAVTLVETKGIGGPLPEDWSQLQQLKIANLNGNSLTGTLPAAWSGMAGLELLGLAQNTLTGTLPSSWANMTRLVDLRLSKNRLDGPLPTSWGTALSRMRICMLFENSLEGGLPSSWSGMTSLENLQLSSNSLTGSLAPSWAALSKLKILYLFENSLSGPLPGAWSGMASLQELALQNNQLSGSVSSSWGGWRRAYNVYLWGNQNLTGCLPPAWRGAVNVGQRIEMEGPYQRGDLLTAGTNITGFC